MSGLGAQLLLVVILTEHTYDRFSIILISNIVMGTTRVQPVAVTRIVELIPARPVVRMLIVAIAFVGIDVFQLEADVALVLLTLSWLRLLPAAATHHPHHAVIIRVVLRSFEPRLMHLKVLALVMLLLMVVLMVLVVLIGRCLRSDIPCQHGLVHRFSTIFTVFIHDAVVVPHSFLWLDRFVELSDQLTVRFRRHLPVMMLRLVDSRLHC